LPIRLSEFLHETFVCFTVITRLSGWGFQRFEEYFHRDWLCGFSD
jgi:hypothetical protein